MRRQESAGLSRIIAGFQCPITAFHFQYKHVYIGRYVCVSFSSGPIAIWSNGTRLKVGTRRFCAVTCTRFRMGYNFARPSCVAEKLSKISDL